ncbi:hypothetical protein [Kitasatospora sp. MBT66]|uniref:hypothetical protein n=1 Tax=Kitasatospora sp. MBT66 TaxID=1444769 RepID=UPI0005BABBB5|nr:hypothetical protein [Kitasatospora sp. MBT66]
MSESGQQEPNELEQFATAAYLGMKAAFIIAMETFCNETGADLDALLGALERDPRIGQLRSVEGFDPWDFRAFLAVLKAENSEALGFFRAMERFPRQALASGPAGASA